MARTNKALKAIRGYTIYRTTSTERGEHTTEEVYAKDEAEARLKHLIHHDLPLWIAVKVEEV